MSSNIQIQRICEHCNTEFTARTTVTRFCSDKCSKRAYKERIKTSKIKKSNAETVAHKNKSIIEIKEKEYLKVKEASTLIGCSSKTIYRLIGSGTLTAFNLSERMTRIRKKDIEKLIELPNQSKIETTPLHFTWSLEECYSIGETQEKFNISEKALYDIIKRNAIPKKKNGKFTYIPKELINKILN